MARTFRVHVKTHANGSDDYEDVVVPDDATDEEIEKECKDAMFNMIEWEYEERTEDEDDDE